MMKKRKWSWGPELPQYFPESHFCSISLNSTSALFLGGRNGIDWIENIPSIYDFKNQRWDTGPSIYEFSNRYKVLMESCTLAMVFGKQKEQKIMALMKTDGMYVLLFDTSRQPLNLYHPILAL